jgi:hypothetical protein
MPEKQPGKESPMTSRREFLVAAGFAAAGGQLRLVDSKDEKVAVHSGESVLFEYRYSRERPKPYIHPLCLPGGRVVSLDSPKDHVHHRGLMVAWSEVNGVDFWGEVNPARHGRIVHQRFERLKEQTPAEIVAQNHWVAEGKVLLVERRTIRVPLPTPDGVWLDWITELKADGTAVKLAAGEHVYNGLGIRFDRRMDEGGVLNSRGTTAVEKANGENATWCSYYHAGAGVALFDHPRNPGHPNAFFVMNKAFGYLSAAPTFRASFDLKAGESIRFHWGALAFAGDPDASVLNRRFDAWRRERR